MKKTKTTMMLMLMMKKKKKKKSFLPACAAVRRVCADKQARWQKHEQISQTEREKNLQFFGIQRFFFEMQKSAFFGEN